MTDNEILAKLADGIRSQFEAIIDERGDDAAFYNLHIRLQLSRMDSSYGEELKKSILTDRNLR